MLCENRLKGRTLRCRLIVRGVLGMARWRMAVVTAVAAFGLTWILLDRGTAQAESPTDAVRTTIERVIRILEDKELKKPNKTQERRRNLETVIAARFDYAEMSKRTLAGQWKSLTQEQRDDFVELFKGFLSDRYAEKIEGYAGEQVQYLSERIEGQYAEVRTKLVSQKVNVPIDYRLIKKVDAWHAYDIVADGISLVKNYRSQFTKIIRHSSYQDLIRRLRDRAIGEEKERAGDRQPKKAS